MKNIGKWRIKNKKGDKVWFVSDNTIYSAIFDKYNPNDSNDYLDTANVKIYKHDMVWDEELCDDGIFSTKEEAIIYLQKELNDKIKKLRQELKFLLDYSKNGKFKEIDF